MVAPRHADELKALRQRALVREVVERREELAVSEIAGRPEDHECGRVHRQPLESFDERVLLAGALRSDGAHQGFSLRSSPEQLAANLGDVLGRDVEVRIDVLGGP